MFEGIKNIFTYLSLKKELMNDYREENLIERFSELYKVPFKVDNAGRLYAIINPLLLNIRNNSSSQIYEYTSEGMTDTTYIKQWVFTNLMAIEKMFAAENLLDVLLFDIQPILNNGTPTGNYLITFTPRGFHEYDKARRTILTVLKITGTVSLVGVLILLGILMF